MIFNIQFYLMTLTRIQCFVLEKTQHQINNNDVAPQEENKQRPHSLPPYLLIQNLSKFPLNPRAALSPLLYSLLLCLIQFHQNVVTCSLRNLSNRFGLVS
jgi:hypothetical protein